MTLDSQLTEPTHLGPYRVDGLLGRGGMGEVFRGFDERLHRAVALKRIRPSDDLSPKARARFRREARVLAGLNHSHIVQIYDLLEADGEDWLVMELVPGSDLASRMAEPVPLETAMLWAKQICSGLAAAHAAGIVHRDLKAGNVMLTVDDSVKLLDFGLAKHVGGEHVSDEKGPEPLSHGISTEGKVLGTVGYMSPEQAQGHELDGRSDLFSLGALLYELLTGRSPFKAENPVETLVNICTAKQRPIRELSPDVPPGVAELVDRLLEKSRSRRPRDARAVADQLDRFLRGQDLNADVPSPYDLETTQLDALDLGPSPLDETTRAEPITRVEIPNPSPSQSPQETSRASGSEGEGSSRSGLWILVVTATFLALGATLWWGSDREQPRAEQQTVSVVVPSTEIDLQGEPMQNIQVLAAGAVQQGLLASLTDFPDLLIREPFRDAPSEPLRLAKAMAVDEVFVSRLECLGGACQVLLRRIQGSSGRILSSQRFAARVEDPLSLSVLTGDHLRLMVSELRSKATPTRTQASPEDYTRYLAAFTAFRTGGPKFSPVDTLASLEEITSKSEGFLEPLLLDALLARQIFGENRSPDLLERALRSAERALELAPEDPRALRGMFSVYREAGRLDEASEILLRALEVMPGDASFLAYQAVLLEEQGQRDEALELMSAAVQREPSFVGLVEMADMSYRAGNIESTRRHLEAALDLVPENYDCLSRLAQMELFSGSLERAAELHEQLVELRPAESELTNLGVAYMLLRQLEEAHRAFERALELAPTSTFALLNLADVTFLGGNRDRAEEIYRTVLERVELDPSPDDSNLQLVKAQALAQLGRSDEAVGTIQAVVRSFPEEPQVLYGASLVFALLEDEASAWWYAKQSLEAGIDPRWFGFSWFDGIRSKIDTRSP